MKGLLFTITFFTLLSCTEDFEIPRFFPTGENLKYEQQYTLVYIDLSSSQDTKSIGFTMASLEELYLHQPSDIKTRFIVKVIDNDFGMKPLFDEKLEPLTDMRNYMLRKYDTLLQNNSQTIKDTIFHYFSKTAPKKSSAKESCICNSLENAHLALNQIDTSNTKIQVIVFSDMFEECGEETSFSKTDFYMCDYFSGSHKSFEELDEMIDLYSPKHLISQRVKPENLYFILTESDSYNEKGRKCLNPQDVESIWKKLFIKLGYEKDDIGSFNGITYSSDLPDRLLNLD